MYNNTFVIVLFGLLASAIGSPDRAMFQAAKLKCVSESGVNPALLMGGPPTTEMLSDDKAKCFAACMAKEFGMFTDGAWNLDKMIANIPEDDPRRAEIVAGLTECAAMKGANDCETVHAGMQCVHEKKIPMHRIMEHGKH